MVKGNILDYAGAPITYIIFPNHGLVSFVKTMQDGRTVEVGAVGPEGATNAYVLLGKNRAILDSVVQIPGSALRIKRDILIHLILEDTSVRSLFEDYCYFALEGCAQTAACNRLHHLDERCCRWLLIAHDSAQSDTFPLTQEFLAMMLGVQRSGVSATARALHKGGLINYARGQVTFLDRKGLEEAACECYVEMHAKCEKLFART
jgi:CRP-like cAMP-binding protein